jgi:polyisoprenoid-binding protein YceI
MKTIKSIGFTFATSLLFWGSLAKAETTYQVDPAQSEVKWVGAKEVGDSHNGTIGIQSGSVKINDGKITDAAIVINMESIANEDVKDPGYNKKLVDHLKSDDFFNVSEFKTATFKMTADKPVSITDGKAQIDGTLTIRNKTQPQVITLDSVTFSDKSASANGKITFDRSQFDVKYNSKSFPNLFKVAADKIIKNEIDLTFSVVAKPAASQSK